jgi:hypothetical protein
MPRREAGKGDGAPHDRGQDVALIVTDLLCDDVSLDEGAGHERGYSRCHRERRSTRRECLFHREGEP